MGQLIAVKKLEKAAGENAAMHGNVDPNREQKAAEAGVPTQAQEVVTKVTKGAEKVEAE